MGGTQPEGSAQATAEQAKGADDRAAETGQQLLQPGRRQWIMGTISAAFLSIYIWIHDLILPPKVLREQMCSADGFRDIQIVTYRVLGGTWMWAGPQGQFVLPSTTRRVTYGTPGSIRSATLSTSCRPGQQDVTNIIKQYAGPDGSWDRHVSPRGFIAILVDIAGFSRDCLQSLEVECFHDSGKGDIDEIWHVLRLFK